MKLRIKNKAEFKEAVQKVRTAFFYY